MCYSAEDPCGSLSMEHSPLWFSFLRPIATLISLGSKPSSIRESAELLLGSLFLGKVLETLRTVSWGSHRANSLISHLQAIPVFCSLRQVSRKI